MTLNLAQRTRNRIAEWNRDRKIRPEDYSCGGDGSLSIAFLDELLFAKFPELWESDKIDTFFVRGEMYESVLQGKTKTINRPRKIRLGEKSDTLHIWRNGRALWKVGQVYTVPRENASEDITQKHSANDDGSFTYTHTIGYDSMGCDPQGRLRLTNIEPLRNHDVLTFEIVE